MYGTQANITINLVSQGFENDVKMYGTQAMLVRTLTMPLFENDVKMYGTQAAEAPKKATKSLRMM